MTKTAAERELKFWSGSPISKGWECFVIAAYSLHDAVQLYAEHVGGERGAQSYLQNYASHLGGTAFHKAVPSPSRGVYFGDQTWKAIQFREPKSRAIIEPIPEDAVVAAKGQPLPENYGKLRVGFDRGIKVDVWRFESPHADKGLADGITAEVRVEKVDREDGVTRRTRWGSGIEFVAKSKLFPEPIRDVDIEKLFERVQEAFRTWEIGQRGIVWEDWLEVVIRPEGIFGSDEGATAGLALGYQMIKRGVDPRNGRVLTINESGVVIDFPKPKDAGLRDGGEETRSKRKKKDWAREDDDDEIGDSRPRADQYAYIPATEENIAALHAVLVAVGAAQSRLAAILQHGKIEATLAALPTVLLLESKP